MRLANIGGTTLLQACRMLNYASAAARPQRQQVAGQVRAFDLLELDGIDLRREPIEVRKATPASI